MKRYKLWRDALIAGFKAVETPEKKKEQIEAAQSVLDEFLTGPFKLLADGLCAVLLATIKTPNS